MFRTRFRPLLTGAAAAVALAAVNATPAAALPVASVAPGSVDFGSVQVGTTSGTTTLTLTNTGDGAMTISSFGIPNAASANPNDFQLVSGGTCSTSVSLAAGDSCTALVRFRPRAG